MKEATKLITLDRHDQRILTLLQQQGRITNNELAEQIGLSPAALLATCKGFGR
ncbi:Lrp/AsnC family transcriptional regulator [Vreelandella titanicae]|uniref:Lrp/AsnC family transcriptional regulator n=1 Tax=Vreelandella titanicae TaxID=664683 RepID=UPI003D2C9A68